MPDKARNGAHLRTMGGRAFLSSIKFYDVDRLELSGYFIYHQVQRSQILQSAYTVYLCVLCGSENKQRLFLYTTLTDWFLQPRWSVFTARYGLGLSI
jgi:hypothetical protein